MTKLFYLIGDISEAIFDILPSVGFLVNYFFMAALAVGIIYWTVYEYKVGSKDGDNYLSR